MTTNLWLSTLLFVGLFLYQNVRSNDVFKLEILNDISADKSEYDDPMEWLEEDVKNSLGMAMIRLSKSSKILVESDKHSSNNAEESQMESEIVCPNKKTKCKDTKTCCVTKYGNYHCCPHKNAVCCSDKWHCCPESTTCDLKTKTCTNSSIAYHTNLHEATTKQPIELEPTSLIGSNSHRFLSKLMRLDKYCMNTQKHCPGEKKCCSMENENYGCCKYKKGVCCPDFATCCPHQTHCDVKNKKCTATPESLIPVNINKIQVSVMCSDKRTPCVNGQKCCLLGLKKETTTSRIQESLESFLYKIGLKVMCLDKTQCQKSSTCCRISKNKFSCCPHREAICCPDMATCCPSGSKCNDKICQKLL